MNRGVTDPKGEKVNKTRGVSFNQDISVFKHENKQRHHMPKLTFRSIVLSVILTATSSCWGDTKTATIKVQQSYLDACPLADSFIFPVGPPNAHKYYNAQAFGKNNHLGEDWNGKGGGNTDLGDPIYSIAKGIVSYAKKSGPGWGNVIRIYHNIGTKKKPEFIESLYGHLKTINVSEGDIIEKGQQLGTMGNVNGLYYAHLHLELRSKIDMPIGGGYSADSNGFIKPTRFIKEHKTSKN